jgi:hypothetical protein
MKHRKLRIVWSVAWREERRERIVDTQARVELCLDELN